MVSTERFVMQPMQKQSILQPECPVYIHCSRRCTDQRSGANFVQVRMVNRSERLVCSVFLRIEGLDKFGESCYVMREVIVPECNALPHAVFGEDRLLVIDRTAVASLQITVERVSFADGMLWRRLPGQKLTSAENWKMCTCAMRNPPKADACMLCGRSFVTEAEKEPDMPVAPTYERPTPIIRPFVPLKPAMPQEQPPRRSRGLIALFIILSVLAVLAVGGLFLYAYLQNILF